MMIDGTSGLARRAPALSANAPVRRGQITLRTISAGAAGRYYLYWPLRDIARLPMLVAVHGISINAREQARVFAPLAEKLGVILVAPVFEPEVFPDYQRLGRSGLGARADKALDAMLDDAAGLTGHAADRICLFGYSGGGQFAHRYTMLNPGRVAAQVVAAPGWFTWPDADQAFPHGIGASARLPGFVASAQLFLSVPTRVIVGSMDRERDSSLRRRRRVERVQGRHRVQRARRWVRAMRAAARGLRMPRLTQLVLLDGCGHDFLDCVERGALDRSAIEFLYPDPSPDPSAKAATRIRRGQQINGVQSYATPDSR